MPSVDEESEDAALIRRLLDGDAKAFEILMESYYVRIGRLASHILGDSLAAEDIAQEVFLRAYQGLSRFRGDASLLTWLSRITVNLCVTALHRRRARSGWRGTAIPASPGADASAELALREQRVAVREAIDSLPVNYRVAIVLSIVDGFAYHEIASLLSIPIGTVKSRISFGKQLLRDKLLPLLPENGP